MSVALVRNPGEGENYQYYSAVIEQVVSTTETDGAVSVVRLAMRRGDAPPLHTHSREDESWVVLSGRLRFWVGSTTLDACDVRDAGPGAYIYSPRLVPHTFQPLTATAEVLVINNPGAVEAYFRSIGSADARRDGEHTDLLAQYGLTLHGDPPRAE
ncbi:cupin domain-containing protein [Streptomyces sp. NRRL F-5630]|uniref:cupin domain-containing protein n=1 Tax=Streptomyces sp. NRRL F-5630 TaxID=1463864 RepID=UPI003D7615CD